MSEVSSFTQQGFRVNCDWEGRVTWPIFSYPPQWSFVKELLRFQFRSKSLIPATNECESNFLISNSIYFQDCANSWHLLWHHTFAALHRVSQYTITWGPMTSRPLELPSKVILWCVMSSEAQLVHNVSAYQMHSRRGNREATWGNWSFYCQKGGRGPLKNWAATAQTAAVHHLTVFVRCPSL